MGKREISDRKGHLKMVVIAEKGRCLEIDW